MPITRVVIETNLRRCLSHWITNSLNNISTGSDTTTSSFCVNVIYLETVLVDVNVLASLLIMVIISYWKKEGRVLTSKGVKKKKKTKGWKS